MSEITINKARVDGVVKLATESVALNIRELHPVEALFGFAEVTGRVIAAQEGSYQVHNELLKLATDHIITTVKASYAAKGDNPAGIRLASK